jgi:hypothetical protein
VSRPTHLRVIEIDDNGEVVEPKCPDCRKRDMEIEGLNKVIRSQGYKLRQYEVDAEEEAYADPLYLVLAGHFLTWRELTRHPNCQFTLDRYHLALPFAKSKKYAPLIERAIRGIAFDHFEKPNKAGRVERYDGWETLFKNAGAFERYVNRCPKEGQA